jgi:hypothetical protein
MSRKPVSGERVVGTTETRGEGACQVGPRRGATGARGRGPGVIPTLHPGAARIVPGSVGAYRRRGFADRLRSRCPGIRYPASGIRARRSRSSDRPSQGEIVMARTRTRGTSRNRNHSATRPAALTALALALVAGVSACGASAGDDKEPETRSFGLHGRTLTVDSDDSALEPVRSGSPGGSRGTSPSAGTRRSPGPWRAATGWCCG